MKRALLHLVWVIPAGILVLIVLLMLAGELGRPVCFELPDGFRGWIRVQYEDPGCPPLRANGLYVVIPILESGQGCTRSTAPEGWRYTRYDYVRRDGTRRRLREERSDQEPAAFAGSYSSQRKRELLFVGTIGEFERFPQPSN